MFVEVFKTGNHTDSSGNSHEYDAGSLDCLANNYSKRLSENPQNTAPVVEGHPRTNDGAKGWVKRLFRRGSTLLADIEIADQSFLEQLNKKIFKNISIAFDEKYELIHLGFLGAVNPAVAGLNKFQYSAVSDFDIIDSQNLIQDENQILLDEIEKLTKLNKKLEMENSDFNKLMKRKEFSEYVDSVIEKSGSKNFNKKISGCLIEILEIAMELDKYESGSLNTERTKDIIGEIVQSAKQNEFSGILKTFEPHLQKNISLDPTRSMLNIKTLGMIENNPELTYEDALNSL